MKRYRYHIHEHFWHESYYPRAKIGLRFALFPIKIDNKWAFLKKYYTLKLIYSAWNLGGSVNVMYYTRTKAFSIFKFKGLLKEERIIRNLLEDKREQQRHIESWPKWFRDALEIKK